MKYRSNDKNHTDPVCGMLISRLSAIAETEYKGKTYYFCAEDCKNAFVAAPESHLRKHRQHGMPATK